MGKRGREGSGCERNMGVWREGDKGTKGMKERKNGGEERQNGRKEWERNTGQM
jgi:hypothetical protein